MLTLLLSLFVSFWSLSTHLWNGPCTVTSFVIHDFSAMFLSTNLRVDWVDFNFRKQLWFHDHMAYLSNEVLFPTNQNFCFPLIAIAFVSNLQNYLEQGCSARKLNRTGSSAWNVLFTARLRDPNFLFSWLEWCIDSLQLWAIEMYLMNMPQSKKKLMPLPWSDLAIRWFSQPVFYCLFELKVDA